MIANTKLSRRSPGSASRAAVSNPCRLGLVLLCGLAFAVVTLAVMEGTLLALDSRVLSTLASLRSPRLLWIMWSVTHLGGMPWIPALLGFLALVVWHVYGLRMLLYWAGYTLGSEVVFLAIRVLTHRPRPHSRAAAYQGQRRSDSLTPIGGRALALGSVSGRRDWRPFPSETPGELARCAVMPLDPKSPSASAGSAASSLPLTHVTPAGGAPQGRWLPPWR
jgi:hypothetical protein